MATSSLIERVRIMDKSNPSPPNPDTFDRLASELDTLRDAATRLSLALQDYRFFVRSAQQPDASKEVVEILAKLKSVT